MVRVVFVCVAVVCALSCAIACATTSRTAPASANEIGDEPRARAETVDVLHKSLVARAARESASTTRSGVARLVTMVPLDEQKRARMADSVSHLLLTERVENQIALRVEKALTPDELHALDEQLGHDDVAAVIGAATGVDPAAQELEKFLQNPSALSADRHRRVKALVDASWSPLVIDRLTRAPVAAAAKIVAAGVDDPARRSDVLHIVDNAPAGDPAALVVAFAFLWRDLDDKTLDGAHDFFTSELGEKSTRALVDGTNAAIDDVATEIASHVH